MIRHFMNSTLPPNRILGVGRVAKNKYHPSTRRRLLHKKLWRLVALKLVPNTTNFPLISWKKITEVNAGSQYNLTRCPPENLGSQRFVFQPNLISTPMSYIAARLATS